jgi:hypothetical protein
MKLLVKVVPLIMLVVLAASIAFAANPVIGVRMNPADAFLYADLWTQVTDTGVATGFKYGATVGTGAATDIDPYLTAFSAQAKIGTMSLGPATVTPTWLNNPGGAEITYVAAMTEYVTYQNAAQTIAVFQAGANTAELATWYLDTNLDAFPGLAPGDPLGPTGVENYTNGIKILEGYKVHVYSSFVSQVPATLTSPGIGTGSYDTQWWITYANPDYIDLSNIPPNCPPILWAKLTGTLNAPSDIFNPDHMWDGTPSALPNFLFRVDGSQNWGVVPEPSTFLLLGAGLAGLGFFRNYRKKG